jgi:predicted ribosome quality control (RQC) complex YloA/Tae2 family protein
MNSLSYLELKSFGQWLQQEMLGAQLQDAWTNGQMIVFQFYKFKEIYLVVDFSTPHPILSYSEVEPPVEKKPKPLILFLHSHAKNLRWAHCEVDSQRGRVIDIHLSGGQRKAEIQIQLIPNAFNILIRAAEKQVSWEKPRDLPISQNQEDSKYEETDWVSRGQAWFVAKFQTRGQDKKPSIKSDPRIRALEKKRKARATIESQLSEDPSLRWQQLGEALKVSEEISPEFKDLYKAQESRIWNLENSFRQAKLLRHKKEGTRSRSEKLKKEIEALERDLEKNPEPQVEQKTESKVSRLLQKTGTKGRRLQIAEGLEAVIGKSATDNLAILRKAQAWDLWMHLKDYPGAHAIILRPRNKEVGSEVIQKVAEWLIRESLSNQKIQWGSSYQVVVAECRYVRPIKGDRLGRVTYHHPQVYSFASKL